MLHNSHVAVFHSMLQLCDYTAYCYIPVTWMEFVTYLATRCNNTFTIAM